MKNVILSLSFIFLVLHLDAQSLVRSSDTNTIYLSLLDSLLIEDQRVRDNEHGRANRIYLKHQADSSLNRNTSKYKLIYDLKRDWQSTDSSNNYYLIHLIHKFGFPSKQLVGEKGYRNAFIIMLHFDDDLGNKILGDLLKTALLNQEIAASDYAKIIDRHCLREGKQIYYEWNPCLFKYLNEEEKKIVLSARKEIGLKSKTFKCSTFGKDQKIE